LKNVYILLVNCNFNWPAVWLWL